MMFVWAIIPLLVLLLVSPGGCLPSEDLPLEIEQLSWEAQQPFLEGMSSRSNLVFSSMCIGSKVELVRRCLIAAARWRYVVREWDIPLVYYVKDFPEEAIAYLKTLHNLYVVVLEEMDWIPSKTYPVAPQRFYSFYKLAAFHLWGYTVLWFDSDAYLLNNPTYLFDMLPNNATGVDVVAWKAQARYHPYDYFNSGIMVFKPTRKVTQEIYEVWKSGTFRLKTGKLSQLTEQEALISVFGKDRVIPLPKCVNYRAQRGYQKSLRHCNITQVVAFHDWEAFTEELPIWCHYWKKALSIGEAPLVCKADRLAPGAPLFSFENCSAIFNPPSQTHLCNASVVDVPWAENFPAAPKKKKISSSSKTK